MRPIIAVLSSLLSTACVVESEDPPVSPELHGWFPASDLTTPPPPPDDMKVLLDQAFTVSFAQVKVTGAAPGFPVRLYGGNGMNNGPCNPSLGCLDFQTPVLLGNAVANVNGSVLFEFDPPWNTYNEIVLQAVQPSGPSPGVSLSETVWVQSDTGSPADGYWMGVEGRAFVTAGTYSGYEEFTFETSWGPQRAGGEPTPAIGAPWPQASPTPWPSLTRCAAPVGGPTPSLSLSTPRSPLPDHA